LEAAVCLQEHHNHQHHHCSLRSTLVLCRLRHRLLGRVVLVEPSEAAVCLQEHQHHHCSLRPILVLCHLHHSLLHSRVSIRVALVVGPQVVQLHHHLTLQEPAVLRASRQPVLGLVLRGDRLLRVAPDLDLQGALLPQRLEHLRSRRALCPMTMILMMKTLKRSRWTKIENRSCERF